MNGSLEEQLAELTKKNEELLASFDIEKENDQETILALQKEISQLSIVKEEQRLQIEDSMQEQETIQGLQQQLQEVTMEKDSVIDDRDKRVNSMKLQRQQE